MTQYQIVGIGNAIVDVIGRCDDAFLARMGIDKGVMQLIETERQFTGVCNPPARIHPLQYLG